MPGDDNAKEIKRLEDKIGDLSDPNGPEAKRLKERIKTLRGDDKTKSDATDAALRSLSMLRDELTKVRAEQRKVQGPEKWTYEDYIRGITAKIDRLQAVAARADADVKWSVEKTGASTWHIFKNGEKYNGELNSREAAEKVIARLTKADSDTTANVVRGQPAKPGIQAKPDGEKLRKILDRTDSLRARADAVDYEITRMASGRLLDH